MSHKSGAGIELSELTRKSARSEAVHRDQRRVTLNEREGMAPRVRADGAVRSEIGLFGQSNEEAQSGETFGISLGSALWRVCRRSWIRDLTEILRRLSELMALPGARPAKAVR